MVHESLLSVLKVYFKTDKNISQHFSPPTTETHLPSKQQLTLTKPTSELIIWFSNPLNSQGHILGDKIASSKCVIFWRRLFESVNDWSRLKSDTVDIVTVPGYVTIVKST